MKRILGTVTAVALFGLSTIANADEATGTVTALDNERGTILLDDGTMYTLSEGISIEGLQPGSEVTVSFEEKDGENVATEVMPAQ